MKHLDAAIEDRWQAIDALMQHMDLWMMVNAQVCAIATLQAVKRDAMIESGTFGR